MFLPSYGATKINFLRSVLCNKKRVLKQSQVTHMVVPRFEELSVKNLYPDAMSDSEISPYLPDLEKNSNKLPERDYFFAILGSLKPDYL